MAVAKRRQQSHQLGERSWQVQDEVVIAKRLAFEQLYLRHRRNCPEFADPAVGCLELIVYAGPRLACPATDPQPGLLLELAPAVCSRRPGAPNRRLSSLYSFVR